MAASPSEPPSLRGTKAGRNEARKLRAALLNNLAAALLLAAFVQPILSVIREARTFSGAELGASFAFFVASVIFFAFGQLIALRLED